MSELRDSIAAELYNIAPKRSCCSKAYLCGVLYGAVRQSSGEYRASFYSQSDAEHTAELISSKFASGDGVCIEKIANGGHRAYSLTFSSKSLCAFLHDVDNGRDIASAAAFRCEACAQSFVRGLIISSAKVSRPKVGYIFEFSVVSDMRASSLSAFLCEHISETGKREKNGRLTLYYKNVQSIFDLLHYAGASHSAYALYDTMIERDVRNNANRATNCTTRNILRAIDSNRRTIDAINKLFASGRDALLSEELLYTARLRIENEEASLAELSALHQPPISKSGLASRLKRLLEIAERSK